MTGLSLTLFGRPALRDASGQVVPWRSKKHMALLVYLALEARAQPVAREVLLELLWAEVPAARGRHSLSQALTALRKRLGSDALPRGTDALQLLSDLRTDLERLERDGELPAAFDRPLQDLEQAGGAAFAHWVDGTRARCADRVRRAVTHKLEAARTSGDLAAAYQHAAQLYRVDPFADVAVQTVAEQQLAEGDKAGAVQLLRAHRARTQEELHCDPSPDVTRLLRRLEAGAVEPAAAKRAAVPSSAHARPTIFVGREPELSRLEALLTEARAGTLTTCLITGPAGIGKSALIRRFAASVTARGWPVWQVSCRDLGPGIPFAAVSELIYALSRDPAVSGTDPRWLAEASRVTPGLRKTYPGIPEPPPVPAEAVRLRLADALSEMLDAVGDGGPSLLVFDDVPDLDPASRDVLTVLIRRMAERPLLLLAAWRTAEDEQRPVEDETSAPLPWQATLRLPPVGAQDALAIIDALSGHESETAPAAPRTAIADLALGNPYLIEMLLSDWQRHREDSLVAAEARGEPTAAKWRPPDTMRRAFERQYHGLGKPAERTLHLLAVAGRQMPHSELASVTGLPTGDTERGTLGLLERGLVRAEGERLGFTNEVHRAFVYYAMPDETRRYLHGRLAKALSVRAEAHDFQVALEASHHYVRAGMTHEAIQAVSTGADLAIAHGAPAEAERALTGVLGALSVSAAPRLYLLLASARNTQGNYRATLEALAGWSAAHADPRDQALGALVRGEALSRARLGDDREASQAAEDALRAAEHCGDDALLVRALHLRAYVAADVGEHELIRDARRRAATIEATTTRPDTRASTLLAQGTCLLYLAEPDAACAKLREAIALFEDLSLDAPLIKAVNLLGIALDFTGATTDARTAFTRAAEIASRIGDSDAAGMGWSNVALTHAICGDFDLAEECQVRANTAYALAPNARQMTKLHKNKAALALNRHLVSAAFEHLETAKQWAPRAGLLPQTSDLLLLEAECHIAAGHPERAWPLVEQAGTISRGKASALGTADYERLRKYQLWTTRGLDAMLAWSPEHDGLQPVLRVRDRLAVRAFEEWVFHQEGLDPPPGPSAFDELRSLGLHGEVSYLAALGITDSWRTQE